MKRKVFTRRAISILLCAVLSASANLHATTAANAVSTPVAAAIPSPAVAPQGGNVNVNGFFSVDPANQGSNFQAAVVLDIPQGLHVNSNRPLGKFAIPTSVRIEAPRGMRISAVSYPRARVRSFRFGGSSEERLAVFEGNAVMRFNVSVPANFQKGVARIRAVVRYQSCSDTVCFQPVTRELILPIAIVDAGSRVNRINGRYFGGRRR